MRLRSKASYRKRQLDQGRVVTERRELPAGTRYCPDCETIKLLEEFPANPQGKKGRHTYCKPCHSVRSNRQRSYSGPGDYHRKYRYGIEPAEYRAMLSSQAGLCAVCRQAPAEHVDHCHDTGAVRGILCFNCNGGLGQFKDRVDILRKAIDYLERTRDPLWLSSDGTDDFPLPSQRPEAAASPTSSEESPPIC